MAQYAGRLHRSYEGKHEVRVYDYVDVHVPSLERMYHKRLRGYAELGYQGRTSDREEEPSRVYDRGTCTEPFAADLSEAARSILIVSPFVQKGRLETLMPILEKAASTGVSVCVLSRPAACYRPDQQEAVRLLLASLEDVGVQVREQMDLCQRFAVIDQSVVWYGSIDLLAYGKTDSDVLRFEDAEVAGELSELFDEY